MIHSQLAKTVAWIVLGALVGLGINRLVAASGGT
jgi:hypothetical protein